MKPNIYKVGRYSVEVKLDEHPDNNPRDNDNIGVMTCFHRRYTLGDPKVKYTQDELKELIERPDVISLPLYLYDHSGITTKPFSCRWDSGQVGYIWVTEAKARAEFGMAVTKEEILKCLEAEVSEYDSFIRGEVYGYIVKDENGEVVDSCWGFIGDETYALQEGKSSAQWHEEKAQLADHLKKTITFPVNNTMIGAKP